MSDRVPDMAVLAYRVSEVERDVGVLGSKVHDQDLAYGALRDQVGVHTEQITGEGGLQKSLSALRTEMGSLRTAFYALTAALIAGSLALVGAILSHAL